MAEAGAASRPASHRPLAGWRRGWGAAVPGATGGGGGRDGDGCARRAYLSAEVGRLSAGLPEPSGDRELACSRL